MSTQVKQGDGSRTTAVAALRRLLIATDGKPDADAALVLGSALAQRERVDADVLSVCDPPPAYFGEAGLIAGSVEVQKVMQDELRRRVEVQRRRTRVEASGRPLLVEVGQPAYVIARVAAERGCDLIVLGLGAHRAVDRVAGSETALQVIRLAGAPVLAVAPPASAPPRRALVAVDFSESSTRAARLALRLVGDVGALFLVHAVADPVLRMAQSREMHDSHVRAAQRMLAEMSHALAVPDGVHVETAVLHGDPPKEMLDFAREAEVELIAAGSHGRSLLQRAVLGSVSTKLVRGAACSVLVCPPNA